MLMSSLAITPGNRLPMPRRRTVTGAEDASAAPSTVGAEVDTVRFLPWRRRVDVRPAGHYPTGAAARYDLRARDPALGGTAGPEAVALIRTADQGVVGTVISPLMICSLKSVELVGTMSSI